MKYNQYEFEVKVWLWPGDLPAGKAGAAWYFVSVPKDISEDITKGFGDRKRGWGSLPVIVTIGATVWNTSIFPDKKLGVYILPLKAVVRKKEGISVDQNIKVFIEINV